MNLGQVWGGLEPESDVWSEDLLAAAAAEIAERESPLIALERSTAGEEAETVRLRCELARLRQDYGRLDRKYAALLAQYQALAGQKKRR